MAAPITVIKIGGSTLGNHDTSLDDIAALHAGGRRFVLVHGGGATISEWLERHGIESRFVRGLRVTDAATLDVVVAVLAGLVNKRLVAELLSRGARAVGLSGAALQMFTHGTITGLLFITVGLLYDRTHTRHIPHLGGEVPRSVVQANDAEPTRTDEEGCPDLA